MKSFFAAVSIAVTVFVFAFFWPSRAVSASPQLGTNPADTCEEWCSTIYVEACPPWTCLEGTLDLACYTAVCNTFKVKMAICRVDACALCAAEAERHANAVAVIRKRYRECVNTCHGLPINQQTACLATCNAQLDADLAAEQALENAAFAAISNAYSACEGQALADFYTAVQTCCR